jgi:hypothetical protein
MADVSGIRLLFEKHHRCFLTLAFAIRAFANLQSAVAVPVWKLAGCENRINISNPITVYLQLAPPIPTYQFRDLTVGPLYLNLSISTFLNSTGWVQTAVQCNLP